MLKIILTAIFLIPLTACPKTPSGSNVSQDSTSSEEAVQREQKQLQEQTYYSDSQDSEAEIRHWLNVPEGQDFEVAKQQLMDKIKQLLEHIQAARTGGQNTAGDILESKKIVNQICKDNSVPTTGGCNILFSALNLFKAPTKGVEDVRKLVMTAEQAHWEALGYFQVFNSKQAELALDPLFGPEGIYLVQRFRANEYFSTSTNSQLKNSLETVLDSVANGSFSNKQHVWYSENRFGDFCEGVRSISRVGSHDRFDPIAFIESWPMKVKGSQSKAINSWYLDSKYTVILGILKVQIPVENSEKDPCVLLNEAGQKTVKLLKDLRRRKTAFLEVLAKKGSNAMDAYDNFAMLLGPYKGVASIEIIEVLGYSHQNKSLEMVQKALLNRVSSYAGKETTILKLAMAVQEYEDEYRQEANKQDAAAKARKAAEHLESLILTQNLIDAVIQGNSERANSNLAGICGKDKTCKLFESALREYKDPAEQEGTSSIRNHVRDILLVEVQKRFSSKASWAMSWVSSNDPYSIKLVVEDLAHYYLVRNLLNALHKHELEPARIYGHRAYVDLSQPVLMLMLRDQFKDSKEAQILLHYVQTDSDEVRVIDSAFSEITQQKFPVYRPAQESGSLETPSSALIPVGCHCDETHCYCPDRAKGLTCDVNRTADAPQNACEVYKFRGNESDFTQHGVSRTYSGIGKLPQVRRGLVPENCYCNENESKCWCKPGTAPAQNTTGREPMLPLDSE